MYALNAANEKLAYQIRRDVPRTVHLRFPKLRKLTAALEEIADGYKQQQDSLCLSGHIGSTDKYNETQLEQYLQERLTGFAAHQETEGNKELGSIIGMIAAAIIGEIIKAIAKRLIEKWLNR